MIISVQDLASMNKALRANWQARQMPILMLVRDLATAKLGTTRRVITLTPCSLTLYQILLEFPFPGPFAASSFYPSSKACRHR